MRSIKNFIIFYLLLLSTGYVYSEDQLPFEVRLRVRMETALIEASESANLFYENEEEFLEELNSNRTNTKLRDLYQNVRNIQIHYHLKMIKSYMSSDKYHKVKGRLKHTLKKITDWNRNKYILEKYYKLVLTKEFFLDQYKNSSKLVRKHGTSMSIAHVSSSVVQAVVCGWLLLNNMPVLSAMFYWASGTLPTFGYYYFVESLYYKFHAWKSFDNKEKMKQFFYTRKYVHEKLKFSFRSDDLLFTFNDKNKTIVLSIHEEGIINRVKKLIGMFKKQAELHELVKFVKKHNLINHEIGRIIAEAHYDDQIKKGLIIFEILKIEETDGHLLLATEFSDNFVEIKNFKDAKFFIQWASKVLRKSKNLDDVLQMFLMLPENTNPIELAHVLDKVIVPEFLYRHDLFNYVRYQRLKLDTKMLVMKLYNTKSYSLDEKVRPLLDRYLIRHFTQFKKYNLKGENVQCINTLDEIDQYLSL